MLYLSEILQQNVWSEIKRQGKLGEDSGATLLDFYVQKEDTSSCCDASPAPLHSFCPGTDRLRHSGFSQQKRLETEWKKRRCLASLPVR